MNTHKRNPDIVKVVKYNPLERKKSDDMLLEWKSYPSIATIIKEARYIIENNRISGTERLISLMQGHESQQSAPLVASIAILVGNAIRSKQSNNSKQSMRPCQTLYYGRYK